MANLKRENHFLPVCYQRAFTDSSGKIWVKFAYQQEPEHRKPCSVGKRRSLYIRKQNGIENDKVEDFFNKAVETPFAALAQRIKSEQNQFAAVTGTEQGVLCRFVASQAVRTLAHKQCVEEQAGGPVDTNTFVSVMARQMWTVLDAWIRNPPKFNFYTTLPHIGEQFITGDSPVLAIQMNDNPVWVPNDAPNLGIANLRQILQNPNQRFWVPLSPYICLSIESHRGGEPHLPPETVDPVFVRRFNNLIRGQSRIFVLAKNKGSLA